MVTMHRPLNVNWKVAVYGADGPHAVTQHYHVEGPDFRRSVDITTGELIIGARDLLLERYKELNA